MVGFTYEGLSWFTGATVMLGALPATEVLIVLALYSIGAHGIMTLNDFKAVEGDKATGLKSLPVTMGVSGAARFACATMAGAQVIVIALLAIWGFTLSALIVGAVLAAQFAAMPKLLRDPKQYAPWYNGVGVTLYVLGMLAARAGPGRLYLMHGSLASPLIEAKNTGFGWVAIVRIGLVQASIGALVMLATTVLNRRDGGGTAVCSRRSRRGWWRGIMRCSLAGRCGAMLRTRAIIAPAGSSAAWRCWRRADCWRRRRRC